MKEEYKLGSILAKFNHIGKIFGKKGYNKPSVMTGEKLTLSEDVGSMWVTLFPNTN